MKSYIARQPIFTPNMSVYGYELLYRDSEINAYNPNVNGDMATKALVSNSVTSFGMNVLSDSKYSFINFTQNSLLSGLPKLLSPTDVIVEILENVTPTQEVLESLMELKKLGFVLALDDFTNNRVQDEIVKLVNIIKVDFMQVRGRTRADLLRQPKMQGKILLAEKVETQEDFLQAKKDGYKLFQGYFFSKPVIFSKEQMEITASTYMRALHELQKRSFSYSKLADIIRLDVFMTYKLLYRINTLNYYRGQRVYSVKQALVRMGIYELKRWLMLVLLQDCATSKSEEFIKIALIRGVFCQKIAEEMHLPTQSGENAFITGMFSIIDSNEEMDLPTILDEVCLSSEIKAALLGKHNVYSKILKFVIDYEEGDIQAIEYFAEIHNVRLKHIVRFYTESVQYADFSFNNTFEDLREQNSMPWI